MAIYSSGYVLDLVMVMRRGSSEWLCYSFQARAGRAVLVMLVGSYD